MRSDEQRDKSIDMLIEKVQYLENELLRLKGIPPVDESVSAYQKPFINASPKSISSTIEQKRETIKSADSLENTIGTRWIGRIGVLAIIFGVAFFLKYSFDNKLIGETGRVILGICWGAVFICAGEYLQKKKNMALYGQMLSGGGLAVLYLALYAGFALYHLIPAPLAAAGMLAVTTTGMTLSIRYSTYSLAAIALLGGFLTPIMLSTGQNQPLALFSYVLLLNLGTMLLLRFRQWPSLVAASLLGTILLYFGWHLEFYSDAQRWLTFGIITTFFAVYNLYILVSQLYSKNEESKTDLIVIFGSAIFYFLAFFAQYNWESTWTVKTFTLILAGFEIGIAKLISNRASSARITTVAYAVVSVIMTVIATFVALERRWILPALSAEMAALGWIGLRLEISALRRLAYLIGLIVLFQFASNVVIYLEPFERFIPVFNSRFLVCSVAVACFYVLINFISSYHDKLDPDERYTREIIFTISQALSLILLSVEVHDFFRFQSPGYVLNWGSSLYAYQASLSVLFALYATLLIGAGIFKRIVGVRVLGIFLLGATVLKVFLVDLSGLQAFYRIISFIVLGLLLLAVSYGYNRYKYFIFGGDSR